MSNQKKSGSADPSGNIAAAYRTVLKANALLPRVGDLPTFPKLDLQVTADPSISKALKTLHGVDNEGLRRQFLDGAAARASLEHARPLALSQTGVGRLGDLSEKFAALNVRIQTGIADSMAKKLKPLLEAWRPQIASIFEGVNRFIETQEALSEESNRFVRKQGWPLPIGTPAALYRQCVGMADAPKNDVKALMRDAFRPGTRAHGHTREVLLGSPVFESRRPLLHQALKAQKRGDWYLVINALLPLVEGVLVDATFPGEQQPKKGRPQKAVARLQETDPSAWFWESAAVNAIETNRAVSRRWRRAVSQFDPSEYGRPGEPRTLNRHAILHGSARRYGTELNALKLYLLLVILGECLSGQWPELSGSN